LCIVNQINCQFDNWIEYVIHCHCNHIKYH
jgi:hypothetical protein